MDLSYGAEYEAFGDEVRAFVEANWKPGADERTPEAEQIAEFRMKAIAAGYLARSIPKQYGGSGQELDLIKNAVISEEFRKAGAPEDPADLGFGLLVPTLLEVGEEWQKEKFIPPTVRGEIRWCQGYSEPGAGSDLASLQTRGELVGDEWVINGQKIWTSTAEVCDYIFCLVRTEPDQAKHAGISYLLVDMHQPGVEVRPLKQMTGNLGFNEVFFTDAKTPKDWIVGERGGGWRVTRATLKHERSGLRDIGDATAMLEPLVTLAKTRTKDGRPAIEQPEVRQKIAELEGAMLANAYALRFRASKVLKGQDPGRIALMAKLNRTDSYQEVVKLAIDLVGDDALLLGAAEEAVSLGFEAPTCPAESDEWVSGFMGSLGFVSAGGTSNIQRNLIAEHGLGLPRDSAAQRSK
jgi:alkylation response protein AidB-like acyl-CoA dehydrogenase